MGSVYLLVGLLAGWVTALVGVVMLLAISMDKDTEGLRAWLDAL